MYWLCGFVALTVFAVGWNAHAGGFLMRRT
jgi:hypothetical protein